MAKWSKQTYEMVAHVMKQTSTWDEVVENLSEVFLMDNHNFDPNKFAEACGAELK